MQNKITLILILFFLYVASLSAQEGFGFEVGIGPTIGNSNEIYAYTLQGNLSFFKEINQKVDIGLTIGALLFLGDNSNSEDRYVGFYPNEYEPQLYLPLALSSMVHLSKKLSFGLDTGYAIYIHIFDNGGGFYYRPIISFKLKEKLALIGSYGGILEYGYTLSSIQIGLKIGF